MADSTSVSIGFNTKEAQSEIRALSSAMKQTQNDFKATDATLKTTGSTLDQLKAKSKSLSTQVQQQSEITSKCEQAVKHYAEAQEAARARLEKANAAYQKGKTELKGNKEELEKLKNEVKKAESAVKTADNQYERWNNKLSQSKAAEAALRAELQQTNEALKKQSTFIAQVQENYKTLDTKTLGLQKGLTATGKVLTTAVTAPIVAASAYAVKAFDEVDEGADIVIEKTGAVGDEAKALEAVYKDVAKTIPAQFTDIGSAVGEINTRLGFTDDKLKTASEDFLKFARINKADVNTAVKLVTRAMGDASIPAEEYKSVLDAITVASQKSGVSIESLTTNLTKYGAPMRALGLDISDSIALFAAWEKSGVNTEIAFSGMKKAISNWGKAGKDSRVEFQKAMQEIKDAPDIAAATTKAIEIFGAKAGPDLADAIKGGRFEVAEYMEALANAGGTVENTYNEIVDGSDEAKLAAQQLKVAMSEVGETIMTSVGPALLDLTHDATALIEKFGELDEGTQKNILRFALFAAAIGPVLSITSKGIKVFNGAAAVLKTLTSSGTAAAAAGGEAATGATAAGSAATAAGEAAATAAGAGGIGAFLSALGAVAGVSAGLALVASAPYIATAGVAVLASKAIDKYYDNLIQSGNEALEQAKDYQNKVKASYDLSDEAKTVKEYYDRYSELKQLQESGTIISDEKAELKEIEQWFIDHYGEYISAEEQKNGVRQESIDFIKQITEAEKERADAEEKAARTEIGKNSGEKRTNAEKAKQEIPQLQARNETFKQQIQDAQKLEINLGTLKAKYEAINNTMNGAERIKAVHQLVEDNQEVFDSYARLTGGQLSFDDIEGSISNLTGKTEEWQKSIDLTDEQITELKGSIEAYKEALVVLQDTVTEDVLKKSGFESIADLFSSGDTAAVERAINGVVVKCKSLGMTTEETALQVGLFRNGFSNLNEAMASGDKAMKAVVDNMNEYMHAVVGLPEDVHFTVNAEGDIDIINTAEEDITELDGSEAEAKVKVDGGDSEETVTTLQELIDKYGASKAVALLEADDNATVTINGVSYRLTEYDKEKGVATLTADDGEAVIKIDTTTGAVRDFSKEKGTAKLDVDNSSAISKISDITKRIKNLVAQPFTAKLSASGIAGNASGTQNAEGGPAIINDQTGVADNRELVEHKGRYYLFNGKNIVVDLDKHDKVFTAAQTKKMLDGIPHFATGSNNTSFETAKSDFEYRQKTSVVTDDEALLWWKKVLEDYAKDADVVREANIEIYELTNKINDNAIKDYKNRIKKQEAASKNWLDYEVKMHNLSIDEQIAAYGRMDDNYRNTLDEMTANTTMTAEELEEVWSEYYDTVRDHEMKIADLRKKNLDDLQKQSLSYIEERTYYNDWENHNDSPEAAYERIKERNSEALLAGDITNDEYIAKMTEAGQKLYEGRLANSKKWLEQQYKYGAISEEQYRAGLKRVKDYTEDYYKKGIISGKYYYEALDDANNELFDNMSATLEAYVNEYYEKQKAMLQARRAEIAAEYDAQDAAEKKADRAKELSDLQAQYKKYQNAVTIEGKKKLQEIQDNIDSLRKEEQKEAREAEKQSRLDELDKENDRIEEEQEQSLKGISKYTAQALGIISGGNDEMISKFNSVIESYNAQQAQLAKTGYDTISKIVDMTNAKLAEIGQNMQSTPVQSGDINFEVNQTFHQNITDETTAMAYGKYAGAAVRNLNIGSLVPGRGGS